jgi:predicted O-methyltransferase YrrM
MKEFIERIEKYSLSLIDNYGLEPYLDDLVQCYFDLPAGTEHYQLLTHLSSLCSDQLILDIGTFHAGSAIALSANPKAHVISFDLVNHRTRDIQKPNLQFRLADVLQSPELIQQASLILLDTYHNGDFEAVFYQALADLCFTGTLILDDIYLNVPMQDFWHSIRRPKMDITHLGHWSGTGAVFFS